MKLAKIVRVNFTFDQFMRAFKDKELTNNFR